MSARNGGPAFPCTPDHLDEGMTLRDYFAAKAMTSFISGEWEFPDGRPTPETIAEDAYTMADAMLTERAKGVGNDQ